MSAQIVTYFCFHQSFQVKFKPGMTAVDISYTGPYCMSAIRSRPPPHGSALLKGRKKNTKSRLKKYVEGLSHPGQLIWAVTSRATGQMAFSKLKSTICFFTCWIKCFKLFSCYLDTKWTWTTWCVEICLCQQQKININPQSSPLLNG